VALIFDCFGIQEHISKDERVFQTTKINSYFFINDKIYFLFFSFKLLGIGRQKYGKKFPLNCIHFLSFCKVIFCVPEK
jgi:hypothetical protein